MPSNDELLHELNEYYPYNFSRIELLREGGNATYAAHTKDKKYFLKCAGAAFADTLRASVDVNLYLQSCGLPVPEIIPTADGNRPFAALGAHFLVLYEYLEATEIDPAKDAEEIGALIGRLHALTDAYQGPLARRDKAFFIGRYLNILTKKGCAQAPAFAAYGERLWRRVEGLPRGYMHGDLYSGNIARGADGRLYLLDFDTSCIGFPLYDLALICNQTDYFKYDPEGLSKTLAVYRRMLQTYQKERRLALCGERALCDLLALYHFALQATIMEIYGFDCVDSAFFDRQLSWLNRWENQCERGLS